MSWPACPECAADTSCYDSRPGNGYVRRRYKCLGRKAHRWTTLEKIVVRVTRADRIVEARGKSMPISKWARKLGISADAIINRLDEQRLSPDEAMRKGRRKPKTLWEAR